MSEAKERQPEDPRNDPVVEEIREIRRRLWEESGGDLQRYNERIRQDAAKARQRIPAAARRSA